MAKKGIEKRSNEGPSDFLIRCQKELPDKKNGLEAFRQAYLNEYYGHIKSHYKFNRIKKELFNP